MGHPMHVNMEKHSQKEYIPRLIFWELTEGCNLKCVHCRATAQPNRNQEELTTDEAFRVIDEIASFADPILVLTGGEPLYRPDFFEIASYATNKGLKVALATNGTLVDAEIARKIKEIGIRRVSISIDGPNEEIHDGFRGVDGAFEQALRGTKYLQEAGVDVQFNTTISKHNVDQIEDILRLAVEKKLLHYIYSCWFQWVVGYKSLRIKCYQQNNMRKY
ncbi:radical SAM protein [Tepidibacillus marianensis]|uniref:radical SAM protein n=1 Tax=Tepidibacillus marianensis TaxID=3131995 RepID=UPI0030D0C70B